MISPSKTQGIDTSRQSDPLNANFNVPRVTNCIPQVSGGFIEGDKVEIMPGASLWLVPPAPHHLIPHGHGNNGHHGFHIPHPHLPGHKRRQSQELPSKEGHRAQGSKELSQHNSIHKTLTELIESTIPPILANSSTSQPLTFVPHITLTSDIDLSALQPNPKAWLERLAVPQAEDVAVSVTSLEVGPTFTKKLFLRCDRGGLQGLGELARWQAVEGLNGVGAEDGRRRAEHWAEEHFDPHVSLFYSVLQVSEEQKVEIQNEILRAGITFDGTGELSGWKGGSIWLVDTSVPIPEWKPIAERKLTTEEDL